MKKRVVLALLMLVPTMGQARDVVKNYTFPDHSYSVTFPCNGRVEKEESEEETYKLYRANMICDQKGVTYAVQYFKFYDISGMKSAKLEDKHYFLREFRDMVRKLYMGDYDSFLIEEEKNTTQGGLPSLEFSLVSDKPDYEHIKTTAMAVLDKNNALYFSATFVKDRENIYNSREFFDSLKRVPQ